MRYRKGAPYAMITNPHARAVAGRREDLDNIFFRSRVEANYARYLSFLNIEWQYEPRVFVFEKIRRGCVSYKPDFYLPGSDRWVEVKGWFDKKSITRLDRFKRYYLDEYNKLSIVLQSKKAISVVTSLGLPYEDYRCIARQVGGFIKNWEF